MAKVGLGIDVLSAAKNRISKVFDDFTKIYISFSGGKDSSVMMHLILDEAVRRNRTVGILFIDLEGQYKLTIDHISEMIHLYKNNIDLYWVALPIALRNAVSQYEPKWICWDSNCKNDWIRQPDKLSITNENHFPFFRKGMEFEEFTPAFGEWYSGGEPTACFVGIRSDESLNRYRTIASNKATYNDLKWSTKCGEALYNFYPIYDWKTQDIWRYNGKFYKCYNKLYDLMHKAGLSIHQSRICQPYGDDQRKGLWLFHLIEPETWARVVARVNGANQGALYAQDSGNILGRIKINKPDNHTWQSFAKLLLESQPPKSKLHFENKIAIFVKWWMDRGYPDGIPDEAHHNDESGKKVPSWRRICKSLLRNDYWCKGLSFSQTKASNYEAYMKSMKNRKQKWVLWI